MAGEPLITVIGNLVADPEARVSQAGKSWCTFRMASTPRVHDRQSNEWTDGEALWLGCRAYGEYADNIVASLMKGSRVIVQGRLTQRSYTDKQGNPRTSLDLEVEEIGPALKWHVATPQRAQDRQQGGGAWGGDQSAGWGQQPPQGQDAWGQPAAPQQQAPPQQQQPWSGSGAGAQQAQPAQGNPWHSAQQNAPQQAGQAQQGGAQQFAGFDDEQPF